MRKVLQLKGLLMVLMLIFSASVNAHDFEVGGIYYNFNEDGSTVSVSYRGTTPYEYGAEYTGSVVIPASVTYNGTTYSVTSIGKFAFYFCSGLTSVVIPNSVTSIGGDAFVGCSGLTSVVIPESVTSIGGGAFQDCSCLTSIVIPNSVTSISEYAFYNCSGLTSVVIPNSVTSISEYAFYNCSGLKEVHITNLSAWCKIKFSDIDANPLNNAKNLYLNGELVTDLVIPDDVTSIGLYAFAGCSGLTSVTIPESVTSIGDGAFVGCSGLTSVVIPNSVTSIGSSAFAGCSGLTSVVIPNSVTSIGSRVFAGCSGLTSVVIPNSVTSIGRSAFAGCSGLTSVVIPNSVTSIYGYAFSNCSGLTSVVIPNSVTLIVTYAFMNCSGLTSLTCLNTTPPSIGNYAFDGLNIAECTLYVPFGCKAAYESATVWSEFANIQELQKTYKVTYIVDGEEYKVLDVPYGEAITALEEPTKEGYTFSGWSEIPKTMPAEDVTVTGSFSKIDGIIGVSADTQVDVYNLNGMKVASKIAVKDLKTELEDGIYIINGRQYLIK